MPGFKITSFKGTAPKISPRLLAEDFGQVAKNCFLGTGDLVPYKAATDDWTVSKSGTMQSLYKFEPGAANADANPPASAGFWFHWTQDVDVVQSPIQNDTWARTYFTGATSICLYGGGKAGDWKEQKKAMDQGVDIIIATPGKLISHLIMKSINVSTIENLIFDEADRMLDMGFYEDICRIISFLPEKRQNLMFSATMPPKIRDLAKRFLTDPFEVSIEISKPSEGVLQAAYLTFDNQKTPLISSLIKGKDEYKSILLFTSTKRKVNDIVKSLRGNGYDVKGISSDLEQQEREDVLMAFTTKKVRVLVATDVISRGIDIKDINLVINYDVPGNPADYVHRIGRTARADTTGVAITLINPDDMYKFRNIETLIENEVPKVKLPEVLGDGPEWRKTSSKGKNNKGGRKKFQGKKKFYGKKKH